MANMYQDEEIILKVKELTNKIKEDKLYQDYMKLRQELKKDESITQTIEEIKRLQRKYVKTNYQDKEVLEKINNLTNELEKIPLYAIYQQKEEELNNNLVFLVYHLFPYLVLAFLYFMCILYIKNQFFKRFKFH